MLRKVLGTVVVFAVFAGLVSAENLKGRILKIDGNKISFATFDKATKKLGEAKEYTVAEGAKVLTGKKKDKKELDGGLKNKLFSKLGKKGRPAMITVNDDGVVTAISVGGVGKKKKKNNNQ